MAKFFLDESNRWKHLWFGVLTGLVGTFILSFIVAVLTEYYDKKKGNKFDKLDIVATLIGGVLGTLILAFLIIFAIKTSIWQVILFLVINFIFIWIVGSFFEGILWLPKAIYESTIELIITKFKQK